jgi:hypothetical protein
MSRTRSNILPVSLLLVIALAIVATPALAAGTVTRSMPAIVDPGATVTVTLTNSSDFTTSPGWGVTETLPAGWTFVSTTADNQSVVGGAYQFVKISATPITYTVTAPAASGAYTFSGTFVDGNRNTGTVGGATSVTVREPAPTVTTVVPVSSYLNRTIYFTVTGQNFQPVSGITWVNFTYGTFDNDNNITINSVASTSINGTMIIGPDAPPGNWNLTVSTEYGGPSVVKTNALTVAKFPAPTITSITPVSGNIGTTVLFTIAGTNFQTDSTKTSVTIYNDITNTVLPTTILSIAPTTVIGTVQIPSTAPAGAYNINVSTADGGTASKPGAFAVGFVGIPTIASLTPVSGYQNTTVNFTVTGTNFEPGITVVKFSNQTTGASLNQTYISYYSATSLTQIGGNITIPYNAPTGPYRLDIITPDGGIVNKINAFTVNAFPAPTITSVVPATAYLNSTISFTVTGQNFETGSAMTWANFTYGAFNNANITINSVTATSINGTMVIGPDATPGKWNMNVTTIDGGPSLVKTSAMAVAQFPAPAISSITPAAGTKNSTVLFTLAGTNFEPAGTSVTIAEDTSGTVLNANLISITPTTIVGNVTIPANVPASLYRLQVTTKDGGTISKLQAFTITPLPLPVINTLTPASGYLNIMVPFTLTGNYFLNGGTTVMLRTVGTTIPATLTSVNTTTVQGSFAIPGTAGTGSYSLYVITTGGGFNSKPNMFTVKTPPVITTISPASGYRSTTVAFTLAGTNFEPGATTVTFLNQSANQSVAGQPPAVTDMDPTIFSVTPTQIVGSVQIPYNATLDLWKINIATVDGGTTSRPGAFTVR